MLNLRNIVRICIYVPIIFTYIWYFNPLPTKKIDDQLKPYVNEVLFIGNQICPSRIESKSSYEIQFNDDDPEIAAYCQRKYFKFYIYVNQKHWGKYNEDDKFQLIAHELGHCIFDLIHSDDPVNYMYYSMNNLKKQDVMNQMIKDMRGHCDK